MSSSVAATVTQKTTELSRSLFRRFRADRKGATAVEFGLLSMPFFFMLMMIVEMSLVFWTRQVLQEATSQAARTVLTGESRTLYTGSQTAQTAAFRDAICARMRMAADCSTRLFVDVQPLGQDFPNVVDSMVTGQSINAASFMMRPVPPSTIAIVRVAYVVPVISAGYFAGLKKLNSGENALQAVVAFKSEPYVN